jgi:hypothetical protein
MKVLAAGLLLLAAANSSGVTFYRDVLPILQAKCQSCHRAGEIAPMAFTTFENSRPWAKAMKAAIVTRKMPPWPADPRFGHFRKRSDAEPG